jgi:hypothetical protein
MRGVFDNYDDAMSRAARARSNVVEKYALKTFRATLTERIGSIRAGLARKP